MASSLSEIRSICSIAIDILTSAKWEDQCARRVSNEAATHVRSPPQNIEIVRHHLE